MAKTLYIPSEQKEQSPPQADRKSWVGAAWGTFIGGIASVMLTAGTATVVAVKRALSGKDINVDAVARTGTIAIALGTIAGTLTGYFTGNKRGKNLDERENATGMHEVKQPGLFNWKLAQGYTLGTLSSRALKQIVYNSTENRSTRNAATWAGLGLTLSGSIFGAVKGKQEMQKEYDAAIKAKHAERQHLADETTPQTASSPEKTESSKPEAKQFTKTEDERRSVSVDLQSATAPSAGR